MFACSHAHILLSILAIIVAYIIKYGSIFNSRDRHEQTAWCPTFTHLHNTRLHASQYSLPEKVD